MEWSSDLGNYEKCLHSRIKRGHGMGTKSTYKPWLGLRVNPGKATIGTPKGLITGRMHQLRTSAARTYLYLLERQSDVRDIRELFPILDTSGTLIICAKFGVAHHYKGVNVEPFLIDFIVTRQVDGQSVDFARSLRFGSGRAAALREKEFRVQFEWCRLHGLDWAPVDASGFTDTLQAALVHLRGWSRHRFEADQGSVKEFSSLFRRCFKPHLTLRELLEACSVKSGLSFEHADNLFRYAGWHNIIPVDIRQPLGLSKPLILLARA